MSEGLLSKIYFPHLPILGVWRQYDEKLLSWSPWWYGEDQYGGTERNCGLVRLDGGISAGQWLPGPCTGAVHYICERGF